MGHSSHHEACVRDRQAHGGAHDGAHVQCAHNGAQAHGEACGAYSGACAQAYIHVSCQSKKPLQYSLCIHQHDMRQFEHGHQVGGHGIPLQSDGHLASQLGQNERLHTRPSLHTHIYNRLGGPHGTWACDTYHQQEYV